MVDVTISAGQQYHKNITADSIRVTADLSGVSTKGTYEIKLQVSIATFNASVKRVSATTVRVKVDDLVQRTIPVRSILEGEPAEGYYVPDPVLSEESIVISGPREELENIVEAVCRIQIEGISEGSKTSHVLELLDAKGEVVPSNVVNGEVPSVIVEMSVLSKRPCPSMPLPPEIASQMSRRAMKWWASRPTRRKWKLWAAPRRWRASRASR